MITWAQLNIRGLGMSKEIRTKVLLGATAMTLAWSFSINGNAATFDADAIQALAKKQGCFKCHAIDKTKKGPSYKKLAAKYKGKEAEGVTAMNKNLTESPVVKLEDGSEEEHKKPDFTPEQRKDIIDWIFSL